MTLPDFLSVTGWWGRNRLRTWKDVWLWNRRKHLVNTLLGRGKVQVTGVCRTKKHIVYISQYLSQYSDKTAFHNMCIIALCTHCHCREVNIQTYTAKYEFSCTGYFQQGRTWYENSTLVQTADHVISNLLVIQI